MHWSRWVVPLAGVQSFQYYNTKRHSLPGKTIVLHPDELHDGEAGTEAGLSEDHAIRSADSLLKSGLFLASEDDSNAFPTRRHNLHRD